MLKGETDEEHVQDSSGGRGDGGVRRIGRGGEQPQAGVSSRRKGRGSGAADPVDPVDRRRGFGGVMFADLTEQQREQIKAIHDAAREAQAGRRRTRSCVSSWNSNCWRTRRTIRRSRR